MPVKTWSTPLVEESAVKVPCALCGGDRFIPHYRCSAGEEGFFAYARCARCGLVQINPQPDPRAVARRYGVRGQETESGADTEAYLNYEIANEAAFLRLQEQALSDAGFFELERELLARAAPNGEKARLLDIGCATGALLSKLAGRGWIAEGVEISPAQAEHCRKKGLTVSSLPLEENRFPENSFDAVLASHLIEHLNNPASFVREIFRVLKPLGRCFITTPNIDGLQSKIFGGAWRSAIFDHLYLFSGKTLRLLLVQAGLPPEKTVTWGGLAAGAGPRRLKKPLDFLAKRFGFGDVMLVRAVKPPRS
ncbi:MAG: class I SAM-dependent methyltransferase [Treponema sp.]|jgi:2-polyprenyl-3-methyl-5-hydroxy-6-metoxy-1,4-benzoquinol methylase|nr:class I SAM-dependent methyltransferase [Treponema sp.]